MSIYLQSYLNKMEISEELYILASAVWTGCVICSIYELIVITRSIVKHSDFIVAIEDFFFWILTSVYIFNQLFQANNGNWRTYFFLGVVLGVWSVHTIWCTLRKVLCKVKKSLKIKEKERMINRK